MKTKTTKTIFLSLTKTLLIGLLLSFGLKANAQICNAAFTYSNTNGVVTFTNTSTPGNGIYITSTSWNFGDGNFSAADSPSHTYTAAGVYNVCLAIYASDSLNTIWCGDSICTQITISAINPPSPCTTNSLFTYSVNNGIVTFTNASTPSAGMLIMGYNWWFGDGNASIATNPVHTYTASGTYTVCLRVAAQDQISLAWCLDTLCVPVTVVVPCTAAYSIKKDSLNPSNYTIYNNSTGSGALNYFWSFGDGSSSTLQYPSHTYAGVGPYLLCLTVSDTLNNCSDTYCDTIGTGTGGAITMTVKSAQVGVSETELVSSLINYPNPFSGSTTVSYILKQDATVEISIVDLLGNLVAIVDSGSKSSGNHATVWNADDVAKGMYLLQLKVNNQVSTKKMIIK